MQKLHQQASQWYEQKGFADEAIEHALRDKDFARAADMIEEYVDHVLHFGERAKLQRCLDEIPVEVTFSAPYLCILYAGNLYIGGRVDEAERYLQAAEQALNLSTSTELDALPVVTDPKLTPGFLLMRVNRWYTYLMKPLAVELLQTMFVVC